MPRFTKQQLFSLRNDIPIRHLIQQELVLPWRQLDGVLRFQCPRCACFHTAIHPKVNLVRCFDCRKNFNTIELVMAVCHTSFLDSVAFLQKYGQKMGGAHHSVQHAPANAEPTKETGKEGTIRLTNSGKPNHIPLREKREIPPGLLHIREILSRL